MQIVSQRQSVVLQDFSNKGRRVHSLPDRSLYALIFPDTAP
jgi:hypothetical protein